MRSDLAIRAEGLGKRYRIGARQQSYKTLRESLSNASTAAFRKVRNGLRRRGQESEDYLVWALRNASFEIRQGEVVGIVGRNGAGKSTLLKVLSRITEPTVGYADLHGRVGSLLEVGTGFHPELTGRENIFLNGAILGMPRSIIKSKFDAMVAFAGVEKFIDTPVKRYSSGMYLRLAFAVAAHLEPEILLVDEVLAVGDAAFQKKCLGKMESVAQEGRTVLFVSHNMAAIRSLCNRGILLRNGEVAGDGDIQEVIHDYFVDLGVMQGDGDAADDDAARSGFGRITLNDGTTNSLDQSEEFELSTHISFQRPVTGFRLFCCFTDMRSQQLIGICRTSDALGFDEVPAGRHRVTVRFPALWLNPGLYSVYFKMFVAGELESAKHLSDTFPLDVFGQSSPVDAVIHPHTDWKLERNRDATSSVHASRTSVSTP